MKNIAIFSHYGLPFEHENTNVDSMLLVKENRFHNNIGNQYFFNAVVKSLKCNKNNLLSYLDCYNEPDKADYFVFPFANNIKDCFISEYINASILLNKTKQPFIITGVGTDSDSNFRIGFNPETVGIISKFYKEVLNRTTSIGVRGDITKNVLTKAFGIEADKIDVIGCPSIRYYGQHLKKRNNYNDFSKDLKIGVNFTAYHYDIKEAIFLYNLLEQYKNSFIFFTDKVEADMLLNNIEISQKDRCHELLPTNKNHFIIRENRARFILFQKDLMSCLNTFDFMIGSRIHSSIVAILSGVPSLLIVHSTRVKEIADYHKIPYIMRSEINSNTSLETLYYKTLYKMQSFYENYDFNLKEYTDFLIKNNIKVNEDFIIN